MASERRLLNHRSVNEALIRFPVICPLCDEESMSSMPVARITRALRLGEAITLYTACHELWWTASEIEVEQIRQYLAVAWLHSPEHASLSAMPPSNTRN